MRKKGEMAMKGNPVIPELMLPQSGMKEVLGQDGKTYLLRNDAMFTGMRHAQGEHSEFFLALRDECQIFGNRCPKCGHIIVPPFMKRCAGCNFTEMRKEYVKDVGIMAATPVITLFAPSRFKEQAPFGTGRVFFETAQGDLSDTAMLVRVRTRDGAIRPGIFHKGTSVKIVFCGERRGEILDLFALPQDELTPEQIAKSPLTENDISWGLAEKFAPGIPTVQEKETLADILILFRMLAERISRSPRATADIANLERMVEVKTTGGKFYFWIAGGKFGVTDNAFLDLDPDIVLTVPDSAVLLRWLRDAIAGGEENLESPPLTDLVMEGTIWLNKPELEIITRLDRVPRSLRRDNR